MYQLILTVVVTFAHPVLSLDGHGVNMVTRRYQVAVTNFPSQSDCQNFAGFPDLESSLTNTFGADTKIVEQSGSCTKQPANTITQ